MIRVTLALSILLCISACQQKNEKTLFRYIPTSQSNIDFENTIEETIDLNILNFHYIYNGGGVGVGDFDKNGLPDLIFSANQADSKIYLNQGDLSFRDITNVSNFQPKGWITGVSIVDINADGWEDVYLSVGGFGCDNNCYNQLFIHQGLDENGIPIFVEQAKQYGLSDGLYTQQATFFDYDLDGDLDVYLLHNVIDDRDKNAPSEKKFINIASADQLLQNNGSVFSDVSEKVGINQRGYGLGVTINDLNADGLPDIYIANDFLSDDLVYLNKGSENGQHLGFDEVGKTMLKHQSYNSMGVDIADINQDAQPDIYVVDMMPEYQERQKTMLGFMNYNKFLLTLRQGYAPQFIRNTLQIHNGFSQDSLLPFSDVGYMTGTYNTDWSWTPLLADFDNDADRDIFVTNGYGKDITDLDFINFSSQMSSFGTAENKMKHLFEIVQAMEEVKMPNFFFENKGDLNFENQSNTWIDPKKSISNGAVYSDLDNDGDLDLIVNNIDEPAFILENQLEQNSKNSYLKIQLKGTPQNTSGIGTKIYIYHKNNTQYHYQSPVRGYLSSVDPIAHFGLDSSTQIDSIKVIWQNGLRQILTNVQTNQTLQINIKDAILKESKSKIVSNTVFEEKEINLENHKENTFQDYNAQRLLLHQHSRQGPCIVAANINGQVGDEIFIGGAKSFRTKIGTKKEDQYVWTYIDDKNAEVIDATFFDFENDGDLDLYVVHGGSEFLKNAAEFQDQLYLNDGKGNFTNHTDLLPNITASGSCVKAADFDQDGDVDLFVGSRLVPRKYPNTPESYLLVNHNGRFIKMTDKLDLPSKIGMVCDAAWTDIDQDGWLDLVVVGEWMPITVFKNQKGNSFEQIYTNQFKHTAGLWNCIQSADIDQDGDMDFIIGNLGLNSRLQASKDQPLVLYKNDFDKNGSPDPIIGFYNKNKVGETKLYPLPARDDVVSQIVKFKARYVKYAEFGAATFEELLQTDLDKKDHLKIYHLATSFIENKGNGQFEIHELPLDAQTAPIQDILIDDINKDKYLDILLVGNDYTAEKNGGWYDAFNGLCLIGNGRGDFEPLSTAESGFYVPNDGRSIVKLKNENDQQQLLIGQNKSAFKLFEYD